MAVFSNQATLSYSGGTTNSNVATGELLETITVTKTPVSASYAPGGRIVYAVSIVNSGAADAAGLTLTDNLGAIAADGETRYPLSYRDGSLLLYAGGAAADVPAVTAGPPMTVSGLTVPANSNLILIYETEVTAYAPLGAGSEITNQVSVVGAAMADPAEASATVPMTERPDLTISKSISPESVSGSEPVTYTFVIQNAGGAAADVGDSVVVTDLLDPILTNLSVTLDGQPMTAATDYTYDETTGRFATAAGAITVPAATFAQGTDGTYTGTPGVAVLTITGTVTGG